MSTTVVVGAQWGDEGKGKVVDILAEDADLVVRFQGGNNAGHTLVIEGEKTVLHHIPSGILRRDVRCVLASGVVVDPEICWDEIEALQARGVISSAEQLTLGAECSVIMPYHRTLDVAREAGPRGVKIGTTGRGIGPCYEDRVGRRAILLGDLLDEQTLRAKLEANLFEKNTLLRAHGCDAHDEDEIAESYLALGARLAPFIREANPLVRDAVGRGDKVLFEGAQGTLLDVGLGTYPFVTSSHTISASVCVGTGVSPREIDAVVGITKAYCTRVGEGPFPTELDDEVGERLRKSGAEFGATTGRPRRCGWLDLPALRYAARINGMTSLAMTKLDVLSGLETIRVATRYRDEETGVLYDEPPFDWRILERVVPQWSEFEGWSDDIGEVDAFGRLPAAARQYVEAIEDLVGVRIGIVSVGPGRHATFER